MNFRPKKKVQVEFIVPDSVDVRAGDLEEFLRQYTRKAKVERHVENTYLSEVSSESSEETPRTSPSARDYVGCQASVTSDKGSSLGSSVGNVPNSFSSDGSVSSVLTDYSGLSSSVVSCVESEPSGRTLGSEDSTRSVDTSSGDEDLSFVSHTESSIHESPVIQAFVRQNDAQDLRLYRAAKRDKEPWEPAGKRTRYW